MLPRFLCTLPAAAFLLAGCEVSSPPYTAAPGDPLPGLSAAELHAFEAGRSLFQRVFTAEEGLGPSFNESRCSSCHDVPTLGGSGADGVRKATRFVEGRCDLLEEHGGDMLQVQLTELAQALGYEVERVPSQATAVASIMAPALYGAGLIETIPDDAILEWADRDDRDGDGISGRPGLAANGQLGRFGWKANFGTVRDFVANAFLNEMGLTSPDHPIEQPLAGQTVTEAADPAPDPEIDDQLLEEVSAYVRLLAVPTGASYPRAVRDSIEEGRRTFERLGCAQCHRPQMRTGDSPVEALSRRSVALYSDLLLHDMGPENASVCAPGAGPSEFRTTPLAGLRLRVHFWHDGRAQSVQAAVRAHGGEAAAARDRFLVIDERERANLLRFLGSL